MPISSLPHLFFFFSIFFVSVLAKCLDDQKTLLLELKSEWNFDSSYSTKLVYWNQSDDCCSWNGVECDASGHVTCLWLRNESISGEIKSSSSLFGLTYLEVFDLDFNSLSGNIPHSFFQLQSLRSLSLSNNLFNGTFQLENIQSLPNLTELELSRNKLSVEVTNADSSWYPFTKLLVLKLAFCNLSVFPDLIKHSPSLRALDLSDNRIVGPIPSWIWGTELIKLNLSCNLLVELQKPYQFPTFLDTVDLHSNQLKGELPPFPEQAIYVDYSSNNFDTTIPTTIISFHIFFLSLANNSLSGELPDSLCSVKQLEVLDLSLNNLRGNIPPCLLENMEILQVINMRGNGIHGSIPDQFPYFFRTLDLSHNNLSGKIPTSIGNCKHLAVLNVGYNNFDDSFPCMLPSSLRVLVLRSNRFHGELRCQKNWPIQLQIVDISFNSFSGSLRPLNFASWRGMILESPPLRVDHSGDNFLSPSYFYRDQVTLTMKGIELKLVKIWPDFTSIDFSSNNFQGEIPDAIGDLTSLYLLNLSHNALTGKIPTSLGALTELEAIDISNNQLNGRIPQEITQLSFLSFLNLSYNKLVGRIPNGRQFQTFSADSFEGNKELCGFPLNRSCSSPPGPGITPSKSKYEEIEWEYVFVALGYVVGLGTVAWMLLCCKSLRERYFEKIEEFADKIFYQRARRRRHELRRREMERRKEVRRQQRSS